MLTAVILVKSTRDALTDLGPKLADVPGVAEVYTVTGEWDFVAIVRVREHDDLAEVVTQRLTKLDGIERTQTMVAFQQFSAHDLEAMFGLGSSNSQPMTWRRCLAWGSRTPASTARSDHSAGAAAARPLRATAGAARCLAAQFASPSLDAGSSGAARWRS